MAKLNCWEFMKCGRQPGGENVADLGICPATEERRLHGVHDGSNAGRSCWVLTGTFCRGEMQGTFAQKSESCRMCDFYKTVKKEEPHNFQLSLLLLKKIADT